MNWNRPFAPNFLKKYDEKLLLNKPEAWSTRCHWVLYYGILFILSLTTICFLYPSDVRANTTMPYWMFFVGIISFLSLIFWIIYLVRFNVFKRFGNISGINRLKVFLMYFFSIALLIFFIYVPQIVETKKANNKYTNDEIANDINQYNVLWNQLEYDSVDHEWGSEVFVKTEYGNGFLSKELYNNLSSLGYTYLVNEHPKTYDSSNLLIQLNKGDTIVHVADSIYKIYYCPTYCHLINADAFSHSSIKELDNQKLFYSLIKNFKHPNLKEVSKKMDAIINKYYFENENENSYKYDYAYEAETSYSDTSYDFRVTNRYFHSNIDHSFDNIVRKKYFFTADMILILSRVLLYFSLGFTLLLFTFRHSTTKTFFVSILASVVISILTSLYLAFSRSDEARIFNSIIFYFIVFTILSILVFNNKKRKLITGISINIFAWMAYFIPLCIAAIFNIKERVRLEELRLRNPLLNIDYSFEERYLVIAEFAGIILLIILIPTLIHKLYRKWYALPEE